MKPLHSAVTLVCILAGVLQPQIGPGAAGGPDAAPPPRTREPIVGLPCEGCEAVFEGLPATPPPVARIGRPDEPGEPLRITGTVFTPAGEPAPGVIVYAYHTDSRGIYPPDDRYRGQAAYRHGLLRGWAMSDAQGRYGFATIRPAGYPGTELPAHVHLHVIEVGRCTYYIDDILFSDDPRLTERQRDAMVSGRGGPGVATPERGDDGVWVVRRDIQLGRGIPGYR